MTLPPLREVIARHDLRATKSLGQNFLLDLNLTGKIARAAGDLTGRTVIEIGPGPGGLTRALLEGPARQVIAVEFDPRAVAALGELEAAYPGRLVVLHADALHADCAALGKPPRAIVANLPYNIATPLLIGWLKQAQDFESLTLMFQREVAERIVAKPGGKAYGRLAVMCNWLCETKILFDIGPQAFTPPPKVTSSVVRLVPRPFISPFVPSSSAKAEDLLQDEKHPERHPWARPEDDGLKDGDGRRMGEAHPPFSAMERVVAAAFGQRRKMLRSALRSTFPETEKTLRSVGINPEARAEELPIKAFVQLAEVFATGGRNALQTFPPG